MPRTHGRIYTSIWADDDFRQLDKDDQRAYLMLLSQPQINNCGVVPYVPKKWIRLAANEDEHAMLDAFANLVDRRFIVVDEETDELLIRTFIKHDRIEKQPQLTEAAKREFLAVESRPIKLVLLGEYPQLFDEIAPQHLKEALPEPLWRDLERGVA